MKYSLPVNEKKQNLKSSELVLTSTELDLTLTELQLNSWN